jgi:acyl carrier protein
MSAITSGLTHDQVSRIVLEVIARVGELPLDDLRLRLSDDLVMDLGLDSIKLMQIWVEIERTLDLQAGDIGISQASTSAAIVEQTQQELDRRAGQA